ncbi:MAG: hypothetical protein JRI23_11550 [Deltaproteobacteria bacterium]|jgi:hypothetical protein|nr:hypothetical protein [Deltaproteobacteria bacterium]MBW2532333.1 hypothetical protein [Deltaproteobacteria bacterium]
MRGVLAVGWGLLLAAACATETAALSKALGEGCLLDSDCEGELVCVFRRCHVQCKSDPDCQVDLLCIRGRADVNVCQLDDEGRCAIDSDCLDTQICAPDLRCRDECRQDPDCVEGQTCSTERLCADAAGLVNGSIPQADTGTQEGIPCDLNSDCEGALLCIGGRCLFECLDDHDCASQLCQDNHCVPSVPPPAECVPNHQLSCDCDNDQTGIKICDASGQWGPCSGCDCAVVAGSWSLDITNIDSSCGPEPDWNSPMNVAQTGCTLEVTGVKLSSTVVSGSVTGDQVIVGPGDYDEANGTTTSTFTFTVVDANLLQGVEEWTWTDGTSSCTNGTADATATR